MTEIFTDDFLQHLPNEPWAGLEAICKKFRKFDSELTEIDWPDFYENYLETLAITEEFCSSKELDITNVPVVTTIYETIPMLRN